MALQPRQLFRRLNAVILASGSATALQFLLNPLLGHRAPYLFYVLAISVVAHLEGTSVALSATGLSLFLINWLFIPPIGDPFSLPRDPQEIGALGLFVLTGACLSLFGGRQRRVQAALRHANDCLSRWNGESN